MASSHTATCGTGLVCQESDGWTTGERREDDGPATGGEDDGATMRGRRGGDGSTTGRRSEGDIAKVVLLSFARRPPVVLPPSCRRPPVVLPPSSLHPPVVPLAFARRPIRRTVRIILTAVRTAFQLPTTSTCPYQA